MPYFVELPLDDGGSMKVEVTRQVQGVQPVGRAKEVVDRISSDTLSVGLDRARVLAREVLDRMRDTVDPPHTVTVEFGITLAAKTGVVIAESSGEAHFTVSAEWRRRE